jgi:hypothetical protein
MREIIEAKLQNVGVDAEKMFRMDDDDMLDMFCRYFDLNTARGIDKELVKENDRLKEELARLYGVDRPFICGDVGEADANGLREYYLICASYGAEGAVMYKKHKDMTKDKS